MNNVSISRKILGSNASRSGLTQRFAVVVSVAMFAACGPAGLVGRSDVGVSSEAGGGDAATVLPRADSGAMDAARQIEAAIPVLPDASRAEVSTASDSAVQEDAGLAPIDAANASDANLDAGALGEWQPGPVLQWSQFSSRSFGLCMSSDGRTLGYTLEPARFEVRRWIDGQWQRVWFADRLFGGERETNLRCALSGDGQRLALALDNHARIMAANADGSYRILAELYAPEATQQFEGMVFSDNGRVAAFTHQITSERRARGVHVYEDTQGDWQNWRRASIEYPSETQTTNPYVESISMNADGSKMLITLQQVAANRTVVLVEKVGSTWRGTYLSSCDTVACTLSRDGNEVTACNVRPDNTGVHCERRLLAGTTLRSLDIAYADVENLGPTTRPTSGFLRLSWRGQVAFFSASMSNDALDVVGLRLYQWRDGSITRFGQGGSIGGGSAVSEDGRVAVIMNSGNAVIETFLR